MTVTLGWWLLPTIVTVVAWALALLWPIAPSRGDYSFGPAIDAAAHVLGAVMTTLTVWLIYFACRTFFG